MNNDESMAEIAFYAEGIYTILLTVNNGIQESKKDSVTISVLPREEIFFEDPKFEIAIRHQLKKPVGEITVTELSSMNSLIYYSIKSFYLISSLKGIEKCKNLTQLNMGHQQITDITPLANLTRLTHLNLTQNHMITDISALSGLIDLKILVIDTNTISDILPLGDLVHLEILNIHHNSIEDISVVSNMKNLKELWLGNAPFGDISAVAELTNLTTLWLAKCEITDISPVRNLTNLGILFLRYNYISDVTPLENLVNIDRFYLEDYNVPRKLDREIRCAIFF